MTSEHWWAVDPIPPDEPKEAVSLTDLAGVTGHELLACLTRRESLELHDKVMHERIARPNPLDTPITGYDALKHLDLPRERFEDDASFAWYQHAREATVTGRISSFAFNMVHIEAVGRMDITTMGDQELKFTPVFIKVKNHPTL